VGGDEGGGSRRKSEWVLDCDYYAYRGGVHGPHFSRLFFISEGRKKDATRARARSTKRRVSDVQRWLGSSGHKAFRAGRTSKWRHLDCEPCHRVAAALRARQDNRDVARLSALGVICNRRSCLEGDVLIVAGR